VFTTLKPGTTPRLHPSIRPISSQGPVVRTDRLLGACAGGEHDDPLGAKLADHLAGSLGGALWRSSLNAADAELRMGELSSVPMGQRPGCIRRAGHGPFVTLVAVPTD